MTTPDELARLSPEQRLVRDALEFCVWVIGEGWIGQGCPSQPEDFLMTYSDETGDMEWETVPNRLSAALVAKARADALEEAAGVADERAAAIVARHPSDITAILRSDSYRLTAIAIRALAEKEPTDE